MALAVESGRRCNYKKKKKKRKKKNRNSFPLQMDATKVSALYFLRRLTEAI